MDLVQVHILFADIYAGADPGFLNGRDTCRALKARVSRHQGGWTWGGVFPSPMGVESGEWAVPLPENFSIFYPGVVHFITLCAF